MLKGAYVVLFSCFLSTATAALSPFYQSKKEIEAILASPELKQSISDVDQIVQISKTPEGYMIVTNSVLVFITVQYTKGKQIGPARFTLEFQKPIEINHRKASS